MKKIIAILLTAILLFGVCSVSVFASEADDIKACKNKTDYADYFFGGYNVDYVANYVCGALINEDDPVYDSNTMTFTLAAAAVDEFMADHFVFTDEMLAQVRERIGYDAEREVYVLDPMLATGGSAIDAVARIKEFNPKAIKFMCIIAAPEGVEAFTTAHPDVEVYCAALDRQLNDHAYILPGLGDAGDRIFGTK